MGTSHRIATVLFITALALLPAAEWRSIVLPIAGKSLGFDPAGQASASPFDLVFLAFCVALVPGAIEFVRRRRFLSPYLGHWPAILCLLALLLATNEHAFPFLTPAVRKVVDARSLLLHTAVMIAVAIYVSELRLETLARGILTFGGACAVGLAVLCALALLEVPYFRTHYPFANPTHVVFPFPTYNVAAIFVTLVCLGMVATAMYLRQPLAIVLGVPVFFLAASLTGSRSNLLVLTVALGVLVGLTFARGIGPRGRVSAAAVAGGVAATALVLVLVGATGWQPVRRAFSIFDDVASDPAALLRGHKGSPRQTMWELALSKAALSKSGDDRRYEVLLTAVRDGCVESSEPISGLHSGREYWMRLRQTGSARRSATLEVFADRGLSERVGTAALADVPAGLSRLSMYLADSGPRYVIQSGKLGEFVLKAGGTALSYRRDAVLYEFDPLNGAPGSPVEAGEHEIEVSAMHRKVRGFVNLAHALPAAGDSTLGYRLRLDQFAYTLPLDAPTMFYVGVHDTNVAAEDGDWTRLRNALLIQHRRVSSELETLGYANLDMEEVWRKLPRASAQERRAEFERLQRARRCAPSGVYHVAQLWKATHAHPVTQRTFGDFYGARTTAEGAFSVATDKSWSSEEHLRYGGSTHNVYLDWYYYESVAALILFVAFALGISVATGIAAYRARRFQCSLLLLLVHLQVVVILLMMYAQPYIWIKYYWVVFGLASGLLLNRDVVVRRIV